MNEREKTLHRIRLVLLTILFIFIIAGCTVGWVNGLSFSQHPEKPFEASIPLVLLIPLIRDFWHKAKKWSEIDLVLALSRIESTRVRADTPKDVLVFLLIERCFGTTNTRTFYKNDNITVPDIASFTISTTYKEESA